MTDLLSCPFCGSEAKRHDIESREYVDNAGASYIECEGCGACTQLHFDRKENLLDSWNRRDRDWREECELAEARLAIAKGQRNEYQKRAQHAERSIKVMRSHLRDAEQRFLGAGDIVGARRVRVAIDDTPDLEECGNRSAGSPP